MPIFFKPTLLSQQISQSSNSVEIFDFFFEHIGLIEENCKYKIVQIDGPLITFECYENKEIASVLEVDRLCSESICYYKTGLTSTLPYHLGLPPAAVTKQSCIHHGDAQCRYVINTEFLDHSWKTQRKKYGNLRVMLPS